MGDFYAQEVLPEPTAMQPHAQLEWVFNQVIALYDNVASQDNFRTALAFYKRYLADTANYDEGLEVDPRFYISSHWDMLALHKVKHWIEVTNVDESEGYLTSSSLAGIMSALRVVMEYAYMHKLIPSPVLNVVLPPAVRETKSRAAYSQDEYNSIFTALASDLKKAKAAVQPKSDGSGAYEIRRYQPTGVGKDPRTVAYPDGRRGVALPPTEGWRCADNMRWYFEHEMNCVPLPATRENRAGEHRGFFQNATRYHGGIERLYDSWSIVVPDWDYVIPLAIELVAKTGLNVESLCSLRRDCLKVDGLTGLPILEYNKPRSGGDKVLPLTVFDTAMASERVNLGQMESQIIAKIINQILALTEPLIAQAEEADKDYLLLYMTTSSANWGSVRRVTMEILNLYYQTFARRYDLKGDDGLPLVFNLSRFRPTKVTQMVKQGVDLLDIMVAKGHKSITTTMAYIDRLHTTGDFHRTIEKKLTQIKENKRVFEITHVPFATTTDAKPGEHVFKGAICGCKHPYDPPEVVKKSGLWREGDSCTYFNMCLQCENVLITEMFLPKLFLYRDEIRSALNNGVNDLPRQGELYRKNLALLDAILSPDVMFSADVLEQAREQANSEAGLVGDVFVTGGIE